jgi:ribosomal 50S subunit-recycling heat shock protein
LRLDLFLSRVGIVKRRTEAARWLKDGRVLVDGQPAKPAGEVRVGQRLRVEEKRRVREWEVLQVPGGNVPKSAYAEYARLLSEEAKEAP